MRDPEPEDLKYAEAEDAYHSASERRDMTYATDHVYHRTVYDVIRHGADGTQGRLATLTKRKEAEICVCELEDMESFDTGDGLEVINRQQPKPRWHGAPTALAVQMAEKEAATKV